MEDESRTLSSYRRAPQCERSVTRVWSEIIQSLRQTQYDELCGEMQGQPDLLAFDQDLPPPRPDMPASKLLSELCACQPAYSAVLACHANVSSIDNKCKVLANELSIKQNQLHDAKIELHDARNRYDVTAADAQLQFQGTRKVPSSRTELIQEFVHDFDEDQREQMVLMLAKLVKFARHRAVLEQSIEQFNIVRRSSSSLVSLFFCLVF